MILMGGSIPTINEIKEALAVTSKEMGPERNADKTKYMVTS
jgi:hypothetical protein